MNIDWKHNSYEIGSDHHKDCPESGPCAALDVSGGEAAVISNLSPFQKIET